MQDFRLTKLADCFEKTSVALALNVHPVIPEIKFFVVHGSALAFQREADVLAMEIYNRDRVTTFVLKIPEFQIPPSTSLSLVSLVTITNS